MTIASATRGRNTYTATGSDSSYAYTFMVFDRTHLTVEVVSPAGVIYPLTLSTDGSTNDYTVAGVGTGGGGTISLLSNAQAWITAGKLTSGWTIVILRTVPLTQIANLRGEGAYNPETNEQQMDLLCYADQQIQDAIDRCIKIPDVELGSSFTMTLPMSAIRKNTYLAFDSNGNITTAAGAIFTALTPTQVVFAGANGLPSGSASLTWDSTHSALTVGLSRFFTIATDNLVIWGGNFNITGHFNIFVGKDCGLSYTSGNSSTAVGYQAMRLTVNGGGAGASGEGNCAFGYVALGVNTTGESLSAFGYTAGASNTTGIESCYFGAAAGYSNQTGNGCTAIGHQASKLATGFKITSLGWQAGYNDTTGFDNLYLGASCDAGAAGIQNAAAIGYSVTVSTSNTMVLGNASLATVRNAGNNACDLGSSALPWKSIYWGTQALSASGTAGSPGYAFNAEPSMGFWRAASGVTNFSSGGVSVLQFGQNISIASTNGIKWWSGANLDAGGSYDVTLLRTGAAAATFTGTLTHANAALFNAGAANAPGIAFSAETSMGFWRAASSVTNFSSGGVSVLQLGANFSLCSTNAIKWWSGANLDSGGSYDVTLTRTASGGIILTSTASQIGFGTAAKGTTDTVGYLCIPSSAGAPTGVPSNIPTGQIPYQYDSTNNKLYAYNGGWKKAQASGVDVIFA